MLGLLAPHTTVKNDGSASFQVSPSRTRPVTASRNVALAVPELVCRSWGRR
jgi:hypothetical protein